MHKCCTCGHPYVDHPEASGPTPLYKVARQALRHAVAQVIYWPDITDTQRRAIERAHRERAEAAR